MTLNQKKYYLLGLQEAVNLIDIELANTQMCEELTNDMHQYSCKICRMHIQELLDALSNNL